MNKRYTIIYDPMDTTSSKQQSDFKAFGISATKEDRRPKVITKDLDDYDAGEVKQNPAVKNLAPAFPTKLIAPKGKSSENLTHNWGLAAIGADKSTVTGSGVTVAVLDTGIDKNHLAFVDMEIEEKDFSGTGNHDHNGHGTHCAGTIFGADVDGVRIGVATGVKQALIGKVLDDDGSGSSEMIFQGIQWALDKGADVISMSIGFDFPGLVQKFIDSGWPADLATSNTLDAFTANLRAFDTLVELAKRRAPFDGEPVIVAAAGNESRRNINSDYRISASLPAASTNMAVGALGQDGNDYRVADFSNSNPILSAPGVDIVSANSGGGLVKYSGTSMACPHVAGLAALWIESLKGLGQPGDANQVYAKLVASATIEGLIDSRSVDVGYGLARAP